ncbi:MAG: anaerobic ribonucleoside-triphosphate reductase [Candidatus Thiodiazotropha lotti]|nr:anaerobic ribonucleoside-triphosphate reductase [Candidatus Thiodiazotropha lotti]MCW4212558.1 anaerobic ribonucleoside-triphosphate reductase [Candidatus Thiodiazotropha lotti]MCW4214540.1 anaerobic ribonucleoside-triphosphate reductase [Candidatus Thiodiazotropha lotti]MCW4218609.1 anaerobic ribonucleoside-triphosphate reductase [Candidatus Thiodiazotropha lotti]
MNKIIELKDEERTRCEVWTRVMGYHRPISAFNPGKQAEQAERLCYREPAPRKTDRSTPHP